MNNQSVSKEIWANLLSFLKETTGKRPKDLNAVLFLIGVQELGKGAINFEKEEKQDLMHIAICKVLSLGDYYQLDHVDADGWPHWNKTHEIPQKDLMAQEDLLKYYIVRYFTEEIGITL